MPIRHAFSLIEVIVVLCLCSFITTLVITNFSFLDATIVRAEMDTLAIICNYLQQLALATNTESVLIFNEQSNSYMFGKYKEKLSQRVRFGVLPGIQGPPGNPHSLVSKAITFPEQKIIFYPTGIISAGTVYVTDKKGTCQYALSNAVSQVSHVRIYKYDRNWKLC